MVDVAGGGAARDTYKRVDITYRTEPLLARRKLQKPVNLYIRSVYRRHDVTVLPHSPERDQPCFSDVYENTLDAGEEQFAIGRLSNTRWWWQHRRQGRRSFGHYGDGQCGRGGH